MSVRPTRQTISNQIFHEMGYEHYEAWLTDQKHIIFQDTKILSHVFNGLLRAVIAEGAKCRAVGKPYPSSWLKLKQVATDIREILVITCVKKSKCELPADVGVRLFIGDGVKVRPNGDRETGTWIIHKDDSDNEDEDPTN